MNTPRYPQAFRTLDGKGRVTVPLDLLPALCLRLAFLGDAVRYTDHAPSTHRAYPAYRKATCFRLLIPAEFRQRLGLRPGDDVALAREGEALFCWRAG